MFSHNGANGPKLYTMFCFVEFARWGSPEVVVYDRGLVSVCNNRNRAIRCRRANQQPNLLMRWQLGRNCDYQTSTTTKVVDDILHSSASAPSWTRTTVADGHTFSAVMCLSLRLFSRSKKTQFLLTTPAFGVPVRVIPTEFLRDLHHKTRISKLSCGIVFEILRLVVLVQYRLVTDGRTDGHAMTENTALA